MLFIMAIVNNITVTSPMYWNRIQIRLSRDKSELSSAEENYTKSVMIFL